MDWRLLKNRQFMLFILGQGIAVFGSTFTQTGLSLYILEKTGSASAFASTLVIGLLPQLLFGLFAGAWVDRIDRKRWIIIIDILRAIVLLGAFLYVIIQPLDMIIIQLLVFFLGICELFFLPAFVTVLPFLVSKDKLVEANSLKTTIIETLSVAAPISAALIFCYIGLSGIFLLNAITFITAAACSYFMKIPAMEKRKQINGLLQDIAAGFKIFHNNAQLLSLVVNGVLTHLFLTAIVLVGFPYIIKQIFSGTNVQVGLVQSMVTVGNIGSILIIAFLKKRVTVPTGILIGVIGMTLTALPLLLLGWDTFSNWLIHFSNGPLWFFCMIVLSMFLVRGAYGSYFISFYQTEVPNEGMGRFFAIMSLSFAIGKVAGLQMYGYLLDHGPFILSLVILTIGLVLKIIVHIPFMKAEKERTLTNSS
ncbi:MFS transporter [Paenibacillus sp. N1-5-1-14]|uniref:MFS transporter n=1 Tax=Paenibacillus radicibacter TaxID=2972488 RepID=UPI002159813D|nr:MFS transporter [Paenibacillus radicibacter]MCR8642936.1 MFS transporter [Paenibacillus radicibacter]